MKKVLLALSALIIVGFNSCTKEEDEVDIDVSKPSYLTKSYWEVTSVMVNPDYYNELSMATETFMVDSPLCFRDNIYDFASTTTFVVDELHLKCNANDPQQTTYFYSITNNDSQLKMWTNNDDPDGSIWFDGEIRTINIDKFTTTQYTYIPATEKTVQTVVTYEANRRKPK